jgi:hypothetical protein
LPHLRKSIRQCDVAKNDGPIWLSLLIELPIQTGGWHAFKKLYIVLTSVTDHTTPVAPYEIYVLVYDVVGRGNLRGVEEQAALTVSGVVDQRSNAQSVAFQIDIKSGLKITEAVEASEHDECYCQ